MSRPSIRMIADKLGLSIGTVSKALRDSHEISEETKKKVLAVVKELQYVPNPYASSLRRQKSKTIAVVLPEVTDSYFSVAINGIETVARERGYHVLIYLTHESFEREEAILKEFQSGRVDGILMSVSEETCSGNHIRQVIDEDVPVVFFDRICEEVKTATITTDDFESGYKATSHLIEQGCKKIAFLKISASLSIINKRLEGYKKALEERKIKYSDADIIRCNDNAENNYLLVRKLLQKKNHPDGLIASVEKLTTPVYQVCKESGLHIPNDIKLISFTNLQTAAILNPPLTTIMQPAFEMGKTAATLLFKGIEKKNFDLASEKIVLPSRLIERESTKKKN
jgi:LacI family transcriptional regulator